MNTSTSTSSQSVFRTRISLLERARVSGSELAWEELHAIYEPFVLRLLGSMGMKGADLEDARQQVFVKLWKNLRSYRRGRTLMAELEKELSFCG